nr:hypothetical protein [Tanacetum cinerariifolium]
MYAEVFGIYVTLIHSLPTNSTQGTHRTPSALRSPSPKVDAAELSMPTRSTVIRLRLPQQKSTHLTPPATVLTVDKADELILQDTLHVSLAEHKIRQEQEAIENVALVEKHLAFEEIEKMVERQEHVVDDSSITRNHEHNIPCTRLEPRSDKKSPKVVFTDVVIPVNVYDEEEKEDEINKELYELKRMEKGKNVEESRIIPSLTPIRSPRIHTDLVSLDTEKLQELMLPHTTPSSKIEKHEMFFIIYEPVHGIIYKNRKKEKKVMRHLEIYKFCDATLNRVLEGLKSYNNDVKYGYIQKDLTKYEVEYLKLFEKEIEDRLKYQRQMRRWESVPKETAADEAVNEEMCDSLERATTTGTSLDVEQDRGNISKTQSKATPNEPSSPGTSSGGGLRRQDTIRDTVAQTRSENVSKQSNDPLLLRVNTLGSGEDILKLNELMEICTNLQKREIELENTKTVQAQEISSLKRRVKRLEKKRRLRTHRLKRLYKIGLSARVESSTEEQSLGENDASKQGRNIANINKDAEITLVDETTKDQRRYDDQEMFDTKIEDITTAGIKETVSTAALITTANVTPDELTMSQALVEIKK